MTGYLIRPVSAGYLVQAGLKRLIIPADRFAPGVMRANGNRVRLERVGTQWRVTDNER